MSRTPLRGVRRLVAVLAVTLTAGALAVPAAHADPGPELVITATVDDSTHLVGKPFPITVTLANQTDRQLTKVTIYRNHLSGSYYSVQDWQGIGPSGQGVTLDPGATRAFTLTGTVWSWRADVPHEEFRRSGWDQSATLTIPLVDPTTTKGSASGVVYGDRNENQAYDEGEGLAGATVSLSGSTLPNLEAVTGADGQFSFPDIPAQRYGLSTHSLPGGWVADSTSWSNVDVGGGDPTSGLRLRGVRPLTEQLHVTGAFDRQTYQAGDPVQVTFTLTNVGTTPLTGITLGCDRFGSVDHLLGWDSWSDILYPATVTVAAGETRTFTETGTVPPTAAKYGGFYAECDFSTEPGPGEGLPNVYIVAHVPGPAGSTGGTIFHDDNGNYTPDAGEAVTDTAVTLVDEVDGSDVATAETDANGHVSFSSVPAGSYTARVADGWTPVDAGSIHVGTCPGCGREWSLIVTR